MISQDILDLYKGSRIVVTGGTGMIGREVVKLLADAGARVQVVSLDKINVDSRAEHIFGDLCDFNFCRELCDGADYVVHAAGIKGSIEVTKSKPASFFVPLLMMNTNILEAARVSNVKKVVYTSSIGAYTSGEVLVESDEMEQSAPMDMYPGWAKRMAEMQIRAYQAQHKLENFAVVRLCNVYGPGDNFDPENAMVIPSLMYRIRSGERPVKIWGDGTAIRDFAFSRDVAKGVILALHHGTNGRYYNLASGQGVTIRELVEALSEVTPFEYEFDVTKPGGFPRRVMDITLAKENIGYAPETSLRQGLEETWNWFLQNSKEYLQRKNYFLEAQP